MAPLCRQVKPGEKLTASGVFCGARGWHLYPEGGIESRGLGLWKPDGCLRFTAIFDFAAHARSRKRTKP